MVKERRVRRTVAQDGPNPIDLHVGARIRLRRKLLHLTQLQLSELLGLTFQQVQKYEKGLNRVSASSLWDISRVLDVPMDFFFDDMEQETLLQSPRMLRLNITGENLLAEDQKSFIDDPMHKKETLELVEAYYKIPNRKIAKELFDLIVALSKNNSLSPTDDYRYFNS